MSERNRLPFDSAAEAEKAGYRRARDCWFFGLRGANGEFINGGTYIKSGSGLMAFGVPFLNTGSVNVQAGNLDLLVGAPSHATDASGPGTVTGTFTGAVGTTMDLGYQDMAATASISGDQVGLSGNIRCRGSPNSDTGGEFVRAVGEAGFPSPRVPILARLRLICRFLEFATSVNSRVTRGHLGPRGARYRRGPVMSATPDRVWRGGR
jgi:hypothetical protein